MFRAANIVNRTIEALACADVHCHIAIFIKQHAWQSEGSNCVGQRLACYGPFQ
jgi:hypothetical protein